MKGLKIKTVRKEFYLSDEVVEALEQYATKFNMTESDSLNDILVDYFNNYDLEQEIKEIDYTNNQDRLLVF